MRALDDRTPEPFNIRFSTTAMKQAEALTPSARERLSRRLIQLADLAAFAVGYSIAVSSVESLVADMEGLPIKYEVNDHARTLTVLEIAETGSGTSREQAVHDIK